jgi:hypothetical protein
VDRGPGSVDTQIKHASVGNGLTEPECHNGYCANNVTDTAQGESSFASNASNSSGISCCDSDEDSASSEDDDDDDSSINSSSKCWATKDGYNLTTFDQTECGTWAINQPLPHPLWAQEAKPPLVIEKVRSIFCLFLNLILLIKIFFFSILALCIRRSYCTN